MAGIYIHIPFCRKKCHYCNFYSIAGLRHKEDFLVALNKEMVLRKDYLDHDPIDTIYFGGGTPTLLKQSEISKILESINHHFHISRDAEITLEANPDDLISGEFQPPSSICTDINRVSIGIQSFQDEDLSYLGRMHRGKDAVQAIEKAQHCGIYNLSVDLIFGIPTLSNSKLEENLDILLTLQIPHISAYALTVESCTVLDRMIQSGNKQTPEESHTAEQFELIRRQLTDYAFEHYEVSSYCLPGFQSRHNTSYWKAVNYLGLGPSAHSYNGVSRQWNKASVNEYIAGISNGTEVFEKEILSDTDRYNEYVMTSLRTSWGCDLSVVSDTFGSSYYDHLIKNMGESTNCLKYLIREGNSIKVSDEGLLFADAVARDLFF
ncbi:MAG: radical SAM family heme chaperone HemW [Bacteroidetes bacterium]|nr:radical SAM family heme chaperone HemW [Bacteroidota bacterium]